MENRNREDARVLWKFVYEDDGRTKVVKGYILEESEFGFNVEAEGTQKKIILGKRGIVKIIEVSQDGNR